MNLMMQKSSSNRDGGGSGRSGESTRKRNSRYYGRSTGSDGMSAFRRSEEMAPKVELPSVMAKRQSVARMLPYGGFSITNGKKNEELWRAAILQVKQTQLLRKVTFALAGDTRITRISERAPPSKIINPSSTSHKTRDPSSVILDVTENLYTIFNFVESAEPPPGFHTFKEGYMHVAKVVRTHEQFLHGMLLKDVEPKSRYPYLTYNLFQTEECGGFKADSSWVKHIQEGHGDKQIHHQSAFEELHSIWLDENDVGRNSLMREPLDDQTVYVVVAFKVDGDLDRLERRWQEWSGANFTLLSMSQELRDKLRRITFYRRLAPLGTFQYVLLVEIREVTAMYRVRDFVSRVNGRYCGHCAAYTIDEILNKDEHTSHRSTGGTLSTCSSAVGGSSGLGSGSKTPSPTSPTGTGTSSPTLLHQIEKPQNPQRRSNVMANRAMVAFMTSKTPNANGNVTKAIIET